MIWKLFKFTPPPKFYNNVIFVNNTYFLIVHSVGLLNHMVGFYFTILIAILLFSIYHQSTIYDISLFININVCIFWRIQDFRTGGRCINAVEISGSGDRFDASLHLSYVYMYVVSVENTIHIEDIAYWQLKYVILYACVICSKIKRTLPPQAMLVHHVQ